MDRMSIVYVKEINQIVLENHSYEIPCIFSIDVGDVQPKYFSWLVNK